MTGWPLWSQSEPRELLRYVQTGVLPTVMPEGVVLPGRSAVPAERRLRRVFEAFAEAGCDYADESFTSTGELQVVRPPDEVFVRPRHGNCLDLSLAFAGACLDAGLHPIVVILDPARIGQPGHVLVMVWLRGDWAGPDHLHLGRQLYPFTDTVMATPPEWPGAGLRAAWHAGGEFVGVDIAGIARRDRASDPVTLEDAVAAAADMLVGDQWKWHVGVDIGAGYHPDGSLPMPGRPLIPPLESAYHLEPLGPGPLAQIRARNRFVRFQERAELDQLLQWCRTGATVSLPCVVAIRGAAGCGKTRLAAELADQLTTNGWHTGFLREELLTATADEISLEWLARVNSPLLVVIDYVEAAPSAALTTLMRHLGVRRRRTVVVMTARDTGDWSPAFDRALDKAGIRVHRHPDLTLADQHPHPDIVYRRAYRAFTTLTTESAVGPGLDPPGGARRWTTLDLILHAWIAAHDATALPSRRAELYDEILDSEFDNWNAALAARRLPGVPTETLRRIAAGISLLTPAPMSLTSTLAAFELDRHTSVRPGELADALRPLLRYGGATRLALRPDPLADHLITTVFGADTAYFDTITDLALIDPSDIHAMARTLTRSADNDATTALSLAGRFLTRHPGRWPAALAVTLTQGGPFVGPLETLAETPDTPLPLAQFAHIIPTGHSSLRRLALIAATRTHNATHAHMEPADLAGSLNNLSVFQSEAGDQAAALATITEAVAQYRVLAEANPAAFLPDLAMSLNNLSGRQSQAGDRAAALAAITEAVAHYRVLAEANPAAFLPDLAMSLNNLSVFESDTGHRAAAVAAITEAVAHFRGLAEANPAAFLPDLAGSLNNLANRQSEVGDRAAALATVTEAVAIRRGLADANRAAFLPDLAGSLDNLALQQSGAGDRAAALVTSIEAVGIRRSLVEVDPVAFLPDLARSLNNLAFRQSETGNRAVALATITEAVAIRRSLVEADPVAFLPDLAGSLDNLAFRQSETGNRAVALATITEAVAIRRSLVEADPVAFLPDLARSLDNLARRQSEVGDRAAALATSTEAVTHYRALAGAEPAAFLPQLAMSLDNLSGRQSEAGDRAAALATGTETVALYRALAGAEPAAFLPSLAGSLNNLSVFESDTGHRAAALAAITEAVAHYRVLAEANPAAFLPDLAGSLNNLASRQSEVGDRAAALATVTEAVAIGRSLAEADPGAFLPDLAMSLNNLASRQSQVGDRAGALATITEAATLYHALAEANPAAFLPSLAGSLNNLAAFQSEAGDPAAALAAITEAVAIGRSLAEADPGAFLPDLAMSLNNLAAFQSAAGDPAAALATGIEAVTLYHALAVANPAAFLPSLAGSLNNLALRQSETGNRAAALATVTEAVAIRRSLAEANPGAFLPDLAMSLNNLASRQSEVGDRAAALDSWEGAWQNQDAAGAAFLRIERYLWRVRSTDGADAATEDVIAGAAYADRDDRDRRFLGEVRRRIRGIVVEPDTIVDRAALPFWTMAPIDDEVVDLVGDWLDIDIPTARIDFLRAHWNALTHSPTRTAVGALSRLHPDIDMVDALDRIITTATTRGLDDTMAELAARAAADELVQNWVRTPTWTESQRFLDHHPALRTDPAHLAILEAGEDDTARQHAAILHLTEYFPIGEVFDAILDPTDAKDLLFTVVTTGNPELIRALWHACPHLSRDPFTGPFTMAVLAALTNGGELPNHDLIETAHTAAAAASERDRRRAAHALRTLHHSSPTIDRLAEILADPEPG